MSNAIALMVEFEVKSERRTEFLSLMLEHASLTLNAEPGCEQFDVLDPKDNSQTVFLYERYCDDAALEEHMNSALLASTRGSYDDMITRKRVVRCAVA